MSRPQMPLDHMVTDFLFQHPPPTENESNSGDDSLPEDPEELAYCDEDDKKPEFSNQNDINDLIRDLNIT